MVDNNTDIEIKVVAAQLGSLSTKVDAGFNDIKNLIRDGSISLSEHIKENKLVLEKIKDDVRKVELDITRFKERWWIFGAAVSVLVTAILQILIKTFSHN